MTSIAIGDASDFMKLSSWRKHVSVSFADFDLVWRSHVYIDLRLCTDFVVARKETSALRWWLSTLFCSMKQNAFLFLVNFMRIWVRRIARDSAEWDCYVSG
jgi:hypothetical protein